MRRAVKKIKQTGRYFLVELRPDDMINGLYTDLGFLFKNVLAAFAVRIRNDGAVHGRFCR